MKRYYDIQQQDDEPALAKLLHAWQVESPGEGFFAALPADIESNLRPRAAAALARPAFALPGLTAALAVAVLALASWSIQRQQASQERLISAAASWSAEQTAGISDVSDEDLTVPQTGAADASFGSAVERLTIETKTGDQLLDDLSSDEIKQVVNALSATRG